MENYDKTKFTQFEINIIELFERLQSATVTAEENGIYYTDDGYKNGYTKGALLEHCIHGINHWYSGSDYAAAIPTRRIKKQVCGANAYRQIHGW